MVERNRLLHQGWPSSSLETNSMTIFLNILLLGCGFLGALAAFGGETWRKTDEPLLKRITRRGWLSLSCLTLALIIGCVKELRSSIAFQEEAAARAALALHLEDARAQLRKTEVRVREMAPLVSSIPRQVHTIGYSLRPSAV